jgi:hypothetical protein
MSFGSGDVVVVIDCHSRRFLYREVLGSCQSRCIMDWIHRCLRNAASTMYLLEMFRNDLKLKQPIRMLDSRF